MDERYTSAELVSSIRDGLQRIGYQERLLLDNYPFSDEVSEKTIDFAAFALDPPSYRNASLGVTLTTNDGFDSVEQYRALGAPQILALDQQNDTARRWKTMAHGEPRLLERIEQVTPERLQNMVLEHQAEWNPSAVLRAKSIGFQGDFVQRDLFDTGLIPALDGMVSQKLDELLTRTIAASKHVYTEHHQGSLNYAALFRLIFRLMTAKLMIDRRHPSASNWVNLDAQEVITEIEALYFHKALTGSIVRDPRVVDAAWQQLRGGFSLANVSAIAIAYVYEKTLVSDETRRQYRTHATPPLLAEYVINSLPIDTLAQEDRRIFEVFAGHAPFLIAALERLRALLPPTMSGEERHAYFVRMLSGLELDAFARDAAIFSLMHADYPNPNGWNITAGDAYELPDFRTLLSSSQVVLCNPPYGRFEHSERQAYPLVKSVYREVEALRRVLEAQPRMLGFVLPRTFIDGQSFRDVRSTIDKQYDDVSVIELPAGIFLHSEVEPVLLLAHGKSGTGRLHRSAKVSKSEYPQFIQTGQLAHQLEWAADGTLWRTPHLNDIWAALFHLPQLGSFVTIRNGVEYSDTTSNYISTVPREGFVSGLSRVIGQLEPFTIRSHSYVSTKSDDMRGNAYLLSWDQPKVLVNAVRLSRGSWRIAAAIDENGLVATHNFHGLWPNSSLPTEVIASIINGPIANAFLNTHTSRRHNTIDRIQQISVPRFTTKQIEALQTYVREYRAYRTRWLENEGDMVELEQRCRALLGQIDAEILAAYDLPPRLERELLDYFADHKRPGPVPFNRYYPADFKPTVPWRIYISQEFSSSSARRTLERLPVLHDPVLSDALKELED